jgi:pimeloyl-ACP methyl ester carboxylesterase
MSDDSVYAVLRPARSEFVPVRGQRYHLNVWGDATRATAARPIVVMLHGWMDVGASFQFVVDVLADERCVIAPDWRGFGRSTGPATDSYWFPDYLGDLDALIDALSPHQPVDLLGHSMGGNVVMIYAAVRTARVRKLVNLEGFGLPASRPDQAPRRYLSWLDELKEPATLHSYDHVDGVAARLRKNNPLLSAARAAWLAPHWAEQRDDGRWHIRADPAHKHANPVLYQKAEVLECWKLIRSPMLWVEGDRTDVAKFWGNRYPRADFDERLKLVPNVQSAVLAPAGHMLHHDQPEALARRLETFLDGT